MDYSELAAQLLQQITVISQHPVQKDTSFFSCGERYLMRYLVDKKSAQPNEISTVMGTSTARTARLLCVLEMKGFIRRRPDKADLRRIIVTPTKSGTQFITGEVNKIQTAMEQMLIKLGDEDAEACVRIVKRIAEMEEFSLEG